MCCIRIEHITRKANVIAGCEDFSLLNKRIDATYFSNEKKTYFEDDLHISRKAKQQQLINLFELWYFNRTIMML